MRHSIEPDRKEVKADSFIEAIKALGMSDLESQQRGCAKKSERPVGVPAAHGHGVMEVHVPGEFGCPRTLVYFAFHKWGRR
jgi:hypothetical protein